MTKLTWTRKPGRPAVYESSGGRWRIIPVPGTTQWDLGTMDLGQLTVDGTPYAAVDIAKAEAERRALREGE